jgi:hypothetical protein
LGVLVDQLEDRFGKTSYGRRDLRLEAEELHVLPDALVQLVFHTARRLQEERPQYRGRYDQEHAGPEPAAGGLARVRIARGELGIHADGPDQPAERTGR